MTKLGLRYGQDSLPSTSLTPEQLKQAERLRTEGLTDKEIAARFFVHPRTISRHLGRRRDLGKRDRSDETQDEQWPSDREWPTDWDAGAFREIGVSDSAAEAHFGIVVAAKAQRQRHLVWYERRVIEVAQTVTDEQFRTSAFWEALAAMPVLGDWIRAVDACDAIQNAIERYRPWIGAPVGRSLLGGVLMSEHGVWARELAARIGLDVKGRTAYQSGARPSGQTLKRAIDREITSRVLSIQHGPDAAVSPALALNALRERVPMFDLTPRGSNYREYSLHQLFIALFIFSKEG